MLEEKNDNLQDADGENVRETTNEIVENQNIKYPKNKFMTIRSMSGRSVCSSSGCSSGTSPSRASTWSTRSAPNAPRVSISRR